MTNDAKQPGLAGARNEVAGQVCELQGNTSAAIADYQAAVALNPGCTVAAARLQVLAPRSE